MEPHPRHQCLIYKGTPTQHLTSLGHRMRQKLEQNFRCLYLNSPIMVAGMRSCLEVAGLDLGAETAKSNLVLSTERPHLVDGRWFDVDRMMAGLEQALDEALRDGYAGLWASGDMTWEFGPEKGNIKLLEYEWKLEEFFRGHPQLEGVCQYHVDTLPGVDMRDVVMAHPAVFVNQTLSLMNPHYVEPYEVVEQVRQNPELKSFLGRVVGQAEA